MGYPCVKNEALEAVDVENEEILAHLNKGYENLVKPLVELVNEEEILDKDDKTVDDKTHYVVLLEWATNDEYGVNVLAVTDNPEKANVVFTESVVTERNIADQNGWTVYTDSETEFDAGYDGFYNENHTNLRIVQKNGAGKIAPEEKKENQKTYVVCIDESYLRDTQYFNSESLSDEEFEESNNGLDVENCWVDVGFNAFVDIVTAASSEEACQKAADKWGYDTRTMFATEIREKK